MVDKMEGGKTNKLKFNVAGFGEKKQKKSDGAPSSPNKKFKGNILFENILFKMKFNHTAVLSVLRKSTQIQHNFLALCAN